jgi:hypothetical protein
MRRLSEVRIRGLRVPPVGRTSAVISVLVPLCERVEQLDGLYREYAEPLRARGVAFEFLFLAEPWTRSHVATLGPLIDGGEPIRVLETGQALGETALLKLGAEHARGDILVTLPAYRRIEADTLPAVLDALDEHTDAVIARRWPRRDSWVNKLQNRVLHQLIAGLSGSNVHDVACGVRVMRRSVLRDLPIYGDFHRFLPLFALREGYRVTEVSAPQHPADKGPWIYSPGIYLRRLVDLLGLAFLLRFTDKPLRFFGMFGGILSVTGAVMLLVLGIQRIGGQGIAGRPILLLSVLLLVLGFQAIALGLIGEIIVHLHAPNRRPYRLVRTPSFVGTEQSEADLIAATASALPRRPAAESATTVLPVSDSEAASG